MFNIRNTAPTVENKFYRNVDYGGYSLAIPITQPGGVENGFTLPNCVGYVNGRQNEVIKEVTGNETHCNNDMIRNAEYIFSECVDKGRPTGVSPKAGGVMCWHDPSNSRHGHVAYVERVEGNGVLLTWSNFGGALFEKQWIYKDANGWNYWGLTYQGCVYNVPEVQSIIDGGTPEPPTPTPQPGDMSPDDYMKKAWCCVTGEFGNEETQKNELEALGYDWGKIKACKKTWVKWYAYYN